MIRVVPLAGPLAFDRARAQPLAAVLVLETIVALKRDPATGCSMMTSEAPGHASRPLAITSTAPLSTSTILRGRLMRGPAWARQLVRQRRLGSVPVSGRRSDRVSAARDRS